MLTFFDALSGRVVFATVTCEVQRCHSNLDLHKFLYEYMPKRVLLHVGHVSILDMRH